MQMSETCGTCAHWNGPPKYGSHNHHGYARCNWTPPILLPVAWTRNPQTANMGHDCPYWALKTGAARTLIESAQSTDGR